MALTARRSGSTSFAASSISRGRSAAILARAARCSGVRARKIVRCCVAFSRWPRGGSLWSAVSAAIELAAASKDTAEEAKLMAVEALIQKACSAIRNRGLTADVPGFSEGLDAVIAAQWAP